MSAPVQGFTFQSINDDHPRNDTICKILRRATQSDNDAREYGPAFLVQFGDEHTMTAYGVELHPWFPV